MRRSVLSSRRPCARWTASWPGRSRSARCSAPDGQPCFKAHARDPSGLAAQRQPRAGHRDLAGGQREADPASAGGGGTRAHRGSAGGRSAERDATATGRVATSIIPVALLAGTAHHQTRPALALLAALAGAGWSRLRPRWTRCAGRRSASLTTSVRDGSLDRRAPSSPLGSGGSDPKGPTDYGPSLTTPQRGLTRLRGPNCPRGCLTRSACVPECERGSAVRRHTPPVAGTIDTRRASTHPLTSRPSSTTTSANGRPVGPDPRTNAPLVS